jgi:hypothetical protein
VTFSIGHPKPITHWSFEDTSRGRGNNSFSRFDFKKSGYPSKRGTLRKKTIFIHELVPKRIGLNKEEPNAFPCRDTVTSLLENVTLRTVGYFRPIWVTESIGGRFLSIIPERPEDPSV